MPNPAPGTSAPVFEPTASAGRGDPAWEESSIITKFDNLYAGDVDMSDIGYAGIPVNERRFSNEHLVTAYDKACKIARTLDRLGREVTRVPLQRQGAGENRIT